MSVNVKQNGNLTKVANNISIVQANWNDKDNTNKSTCIKNQPETLNTLEEISASTNENALAGANAVKELNDSLGVDIKLIDGVPHWSARGADSFSPFRGSFEYVDAISAAFNNTTKNNEIIIPSNVYKVTMICVSTSSRGTTTTISGDCIVSQETLSTYERVVTNCYEYNNDVYELELNGQGGTITISRKSAGNCSFTDTIFY